MGNSIFSGIAGAALSVAGGIYQNEQNKEQADIAFERQRQLIREANIYNSPSAQMERLKEAGLNPNLIYGNGPGSMVSASVGTPPAARQENIMQNIGIYATMKQLDLQERDIKIREAQNPSIIKKNEAEADKTNSEIDVNTQSMLNMMQTREHQNQLIELNKTALTIQNETNRFNLEQRKLLAPLVKLNQMLQNKAIVNQIDATNTRLAYERELKDSRLKLDDATIQEIGSRYNLNDQSKEFLDVMNDLQISREKIRTAKDEYNYNDWLNEFFWSCERIMDTFNPLKFLGAVAK